MSSDFFRKQTFITSVVQAVMSGMDYVLYTLAADPPPSPGHSVTSQAADSTRLPMSRPARRGVATRT